MLIRFRTNLVEATVLNILLLWIGMVLFHFILLIQLRKYNFLLNLRNLNFGGSTSQKYETRQQNLFQQDPIFHFQVNQMAAIIKRIIFNLALVI